MSTNTHRSRKLPSHHNVERSSLLMALLGIGYWGGCSFKNFDYLQKGSSPANGGEAPSGGGGGAEAGAGGQAEGGTGGDSGTQCGLGLTYCTEASECVDLTVGNPSGSTIENCGTCGNTCNVSNASSASCAASKCDLSCNSGFADCNQSTANDGCESGVADVVTACGACGRTCSDSGAQTLVCTDGLCKPTCRASYLDCNADDGAGADDGCEVFLDALKTCGTSCINGVTCATNQVCNAGSCGAPQGIVVLSVPLTATGQKQRFADKFFALPDLADGTLNLRLYAPGAANEQLNLYISDEAFTAGILGTNVAMGALSQGWTDVVVQVGGITGAFNPTAVSQINIEISAEGAGPWLNPVILYVDRIWSSNGLVNDTFDSSEGEMVASSQQVVPNSKVSWLAAMP